MRQVANILLDQEILLESGTNELEILVFDVADHVFGINVAKVREVLPTPEITSLPRAHSSVRGVFKLRDKVVPCVSLCDHLGVTSTAEQAESKVILTDFNQQQTAFLVDSVERIYRMSWENIMALPGLKALAETPVTALARCDERLIVMLDFEMILDQVTERFFRAAAVENPRQLDRTSLRILLADDSPTVREAVSNTLRASGYSQLTVFQNGELAWQWLEARLREAGRLEGIADLLISDVEMPQVDGLHLTKRIKEHPELRRLPVLLYSSIVTPDNFKKGKAVGADAQISKPQLHQVVQLADELITSARRTQGTDRPGPAADTPEAPLPATGEKPRPTELAARAAREALSPALTTNSEMTPTAGVPAARHELTAQPAPVTTSKPTPQPTPEMSPATRTDTGRSQPPRPVVAPEPSTSRPAVPLPANPLWSTFRSELIQHAAGLHELLRGPAAGQTSVEWRRCWMRALHTIKSAAMVVPCDEVSHTTHLAESLVEALLCGSESSLAGTPAAVVIQDYVDWLHRLAHEPDVQPYLRRCIDLQAALTECLAATS
jgi:two-component system chemotaxis response regulator CheV